LNISPDQLRFRYGVYGKPYLAKGFCRVQFNLAHSHELALYAFTRGRNVGVDLEYVHYIPDVEKVAGSFLSKRESAMYKMLPRSQRLRAFFDYWTRKEAYCKAIGTGLALACELLDAPAVSGDTAFRRNLENDERQACNWSITSFAPALDYAAALVVGGRNHRLHCFQFVV
jgi:4'-phosphopantetheinyl transferase